MTLTATLGRFVGLSSGQKTSLRSYAELYRQRRALARLDDNALQDLGLTRSDVAREAARPVWDVPATWRC